ncbi:MAG: hypothetical protein CMH53_02660 [Myxococcales bacterium]|nr:hypothetical protein [Myxococcales bacterium]
MTENRNLLTARSPEHSEVVMTQLVLPQHTNAVGTAFGGQVLSWVDIAAGVCAGRHARAVCVTAGFDQVHFKLPIRHGDVVVIIQPSASSRNDTEFVVEHFNECIFQVIQQIPLSMLQK